jgi:hypothetical protein
MREFKREVEYIRKKKLAKDFSLSRTVQPHLYSAISSCLVVNWQLGQLITWQLHLLKKLKLKKNILSISLNIFSFSCLNKLF